MPCLVLVGRLWNHTWEMGVVGEQGSSRYVVLFRPCCIFMEPCLAQGLRYSVYRLLNSVIGIIQT